MGFLRTIVLICHIKCRYLQHKSELMRKIDFDIMPSHKVSLTETSLREWLNEPVALDYGMIIICRKGKANISVNFDSWSLNEDAVITLFPNDVAIITEMSDDFLVETLRYDASLLREASLQLEQTVYSQLRKDRCRTESVIVTNIINNMFSLLKVYFDQPECTCLEQLVLLQLKAFFLGFYDYLYRYPTEKHEETGTRRTRELFNQFMVSLENHYKESRDVSYYASLLNITPKYLNTITQKIAGKTVKVIIDHFVVLQLKQTLRSSPKSIKELSWEYRFSDMSFFCRYFKQHTGITPQQFRKAGKGV